jgi:hypothetical protein
VNPARSATLQRLAILAGVCVVVGAVVVMGATGFERSTRGPAGETGELPDAWQRGFVFTAWSRGGYADKPADASLEALRRSGADSVALIAMQYQPTVYSNYVGADPRFTQSDHSLTVTTRRAQDLGLKVRLRVMVDPSRGSSRTEIAPRDPDAWFVNYQRRLLHYARLAQRLRIDTLDIGVELASLTGPKYSLRWRHLAQAARTVFRGKVSYDALFSEYRQIDWWDALHEIGIDAYFPLAEGPARSAGEVTAAWSRFVDDAGREHRYLSDLAALARRFRRPIVFTELGYPSSTNALVTPWEAGHVYSAEQQRLALTGTFRALAGQPWLRGVYLWEWRARSSAGGPGNTDYTVQGKPAEKSVRRWFSGTQRRAPEPPR